MSHGLLCCRDVVDTHRIDWGIADWLINGDNRDVPRVQQIQFLHPLLNRDDNRASDGCCCKNLNILTLLFRSRIGRIIAHDEQIPVLPHFLLDPTHQFDEERILNISYQQSDECWTATGKCTRGPVGLILEAGYRCTHALCRLRIDWSGSVEHSRDCRHRHTSCLRHFTHCNRFPVICVISFTQMSIYFTFCLWWRKTSLIFMPVHPSNLFLWKRFHPQDTILWEPCTWLCPLYTMHIMFT